MIILIQIISFHCCVYLLLLTSTTLLKTKSCASKQRNEFTAPKKKLQVKSSFWALLLPLLSLFLLYWSLCFECVPYFIASYAIMYIFVVVVTRIAIAYVASLLLLPLCSGSGEWGNVPGITGTLEKTLQYSNSPAKKKSHLFTLFRKLCGWIGCSCVFRDYYFLLSKPFNPIDFLKNMLTPFIICTKLLTIINSQ